MLRQTEPHYEETSGIGWTCDRHTTTVIISVSQTRLYLRDRKEQGISRYISSTCAHWTNKKGQPFVAYFDYYYNDDLSCDQGSYSNQRALTVYRIDPTRIVIEGSYSRPDPNILVLEMENAPKEITPDNIDRKVAALALFA
jgi:hypothetical protein